MTTNVLAQRRLRVATAMLAATLVAACGGGGDTPSAPNGFQGVVSASVPLIIAPRVAASADGDTWLAWVEGDNTQQSLIAACINSVGVVMKAPVTSNFAGALRDLQMTMVGTTPVVTWRQYLQAGGVTVGAASFQGFFWFSEFVSAASFEGDVYSVALPNGNMSLEWTRIDSTGRFQLVAARRSPAGLWSTPAVIRTGAPDVTLVRSSQSSDGSAGLMALWSEAPVASGAVVDPPQTLLSSQYDEVTGAWAVPLAVDSGGFYVSPALASTGVAGWVAAWLSGPVGVQTAVVGKRFEAGAWLAATDRIDQGQDDRLNELVVTARNHRVYAGWIGVPAAAAGGKVRAAAFDAVADRWLTPSLLGAPAQGLPIGLVLRADGQGTAAAAWTVSQGIGGLQFDLTDGTGTWQGASQLDPDGLAPNLAFFSAGDIVTTWYRLVAGGFEDIVVRRVR